MTDLTPFSVAIEQPVLDDLHFRLSRTRWARALDAEPWALGSDPQVLRPLVAYWLDGFDWRTQERLINLLPQNIARVDGLTIHFVHARPSPKATTSTPIVLLHGWPGTFLEMARLVPLLTSPSSAGHAFEVIAPSLPGFGFSSRPSKVGYGYRAMASTIHRLLTETLGIDRFALHGTDVGASVAGWLAVDHAASVVGVHTMEPATPRTSFDPPASPPTEDERAFLADFATWAQSEGAYFQLQATKPATLAAALTDSPVGALAWLAEKYRSWSDCDGDLLRRYPADDLLTIVTLYWVTDTLSTSIHAYHQSRQNDGPVAPNERSGVPGGVTLSRRLPAAPPRHARELVERLYDVRHWVQLPQGGHFASWEEPQLVANSIRTFLTAIGGDEGVDDRSRT